MGFGCNACGVTGCRIIDSPRERLIAILTNVFVPCNGRFSTLIALITMFFVGTKAGLFSSIMSVGILTMVILLRDSYYICHFQNIIPNTLKRGGIFFCARASALSYTTSWQDYRAFYFR
jgi:hypothetical protein